MMPALETAGKHPEWSRLMGRMYAEGMMPALVDRHFKPTGRRFVAALRRALPGLTDREFLWRVDFMIGAMAHTMVHVHALGPDVTEASEVHAPHARSRMTSLIAFLSAGFRAPALIVEGIEKVEVSK